MPVEGLRPSQVRSDVDGDRRVFRRAASLRVMPKPLLDRPWPWVVAAGVLVVAFVLTVVDVRVGDPEPRPVGSADDIEQLAERDDLNVLFILIDTLRADRLGVYGYERETSPNLDRLARGGMKFTRGYATCQVCSPSRASILTGKYPPNHGITTWIGEVSSERWRSLGRNDSLLPPAYERALRAREVTLAEALHEAGYRTFFAGKWHLGGDGSLPTDHGFEVNLGGWEVGRPIGGYFAPWENPKLPRGRDGESLPIRLAQEAVKFIESNRDRPFFVYLSF